MNIAKGWAFGVAAALVGALAWAAISFYANMEIGYLAWGIGALVGFAVAFGIRGGGAAAGVMAVALTVASICGGKYLGAYWAIDQVFADSIQEAGMNDVNDNSLAGGVAGRLLEKAQEEGKFTDFEPNMEATDPADFFPAEIWTEANEQVSKMTQDEKVQMANSFRTEMEGTLNESKVVIAWQIFQNSFGVIDIIFFLLGIATAWRLASADGIADGPAPQAS